MGHLQLKSEFFLTGGCDGNLSFSNDGTHLYVPFYSKFYALGINGDSLTQLASTQVDVGGTNHIYGCLYHNGVVYVANNYLSNKLNAYTFDGANFSSRIASIMPYSAYGLLIDANNYIYCSEMVLTFNGSNFTTRTSNSKFNGSRSPYEKPYFWATDGTYIFAYTSAGKLWALSYNGTTYTDITSITLNNHQYGQIYYYNGKIYFAASNGYVQTYTFNGSTFTAVDSWLVGVPADSGLNIYVDDKFIYYSTYNHFYLMDVNTGAVIESINYQDVGYTTGFNFSGSYVYNGHLYLVKSYRNTTINGVSDYWSSILVYKVKRELSPEFTADKYVAFTDDTFNFTTDIGASSASSWLYNFGDGDAVLSSSLHADHSYYPGIYSPSLTLESSAIAAPNVTVNYNSELSASNIIPIISETVKFTDGSASYYYSNTIQVMKIDFGDGSTVEQNSDPGHVFSHSYISAGIYPLSLSAVDISSNCSVSNFNLQVLADSIDVLKTDYVTTGGPRVLRQSGYTNKKINLTSFLPERIEETDVYDLVKVFEDYLNTMYDGDGGLSISAYDMNNSAYEIKYDYQEADVSSISVLEKVARLADLHNPDLINIDMMPSLAKYLGYGVNIYKDEIGDQALENSLSSVSDSERYQRFMIGNLPNWYKIKTTNKMVKVMLYSFGLIGDIYNYYTKDYSSIGNNNWKIDDSKILSNIPDDWFLTPHFAIVIDIDAKILNSSSPSKTMAIIIKSGDKIRRAIQSVKPQNTVFKGILGKSQQDAQLYIGLNSRLTNYVKINADVPADYWYTPTETLVGAMSQYNSVARLKSGTDDSWIDGLYGFSADTSIGWWPQIPAFNWAMMGSAVDVGIQYRVEYELNFDIPYIGSNFGINYISAGMSFAYATSLVVDTLVLIPDSVTTASGNAGSATNITLTKSFAWTNTVSRDMWFEMMFRSHAPSGSGSVGIAVNHAWLKIRKLT